MARATTCRCCDRKYPYPVKKSPATRFYCPTCAPLSEETRSMFELLNKRIRRLRGEVDKLHEKLAERDRT